VLPLEGQASADTNAVNIALIVMVVLLAVGAFISAAAVGVSSAIFNALIVVLMLAFVAVVIVTSYRKQKHDLQVARAIEQMPPPLAGHEREALSYFAPPPREPSNPLAAAGGFFSAIGMCAAGFVILAATSGFTGSRGGSSATARGERTFFLLFVVAIAVGYMMGAPVLSRRKGWKGFGTGAIIGLSLGMLALGPCAFCYLITLGA
jgi:FtsH-binding integral membrane protein